MRACVFFEREGKRSARTTSPETPNVVRAYVVNGDARLKSYGSSKRYGIP